MANELDKSRREELRQQAERRLKAIEAAPTATQSDAAKAVQMLVNYYPQQKAHNPEAYMRAVQTVLTDIPSDLLATFSDPKNGIVTQCTFLPTLAEIHKWLEPHLVRVEIRKQQIRNEIDTLLPPPPAPTKEERARRIAAMEHKFPRKPKATPFFWLQPDYTDHADDERLRAVQRPDTPENRASLLQSDLMRGDDDPNADQS